MARAGRRPGAVAGSRPDAGRARHPPDRGDAAGRPGPGPRLRVPVRGRAAADGGRHRLPGAPARDRRAVSDRPDSVVELRRVRKDYGSTRALNDVDLRIDAGEVVAVLGPNGAGKTTAI